MRGISNCILFVDLLHLTQRLCNGEFGSRLLLDLIHTNTWSSLDQSKTTSDSVNVEHSLYQKVSVASSQQFNRRQLTNSVIIVLTHLAPVKGNVQCSTIFDTPYLST